MSRRRNNRCLPIRSEESVFIQLADLLSGVVSFHFNNNDVKDNTKYEFKKIRGTYW